MYDYSIFNHCLFDGSKSKHDYFKNEHSMEKVCSDQRKHKMEIVGYKKGELYHWQIDRKIHTHQTIWHMC